MAAGRQGAREYWDAPNFQEIHQGDIRAFVTSVCQAARQIEAGHLTRADLAPGIRRLADRYSLAAETSNLRMLLGRIADCFAGARSRLVEPV